MSEEIIVEGMKSHYFFTGTLRHQGYEIYFSKDKVFGIKMGSKGLFLTPGLLLRPATKMFYDEDKIHNVKFDIEVLKKESDIRFDKSQVKEVILEKPGRPPKEGYFKISSNSNQNIKVLFYANQYTKVKFLFQKHFLDKIKIIE